MKKKLGRGNDIKFWVYIWISNKRPKELFPRIFYISKDKNIMIEHLGYWSEGRWIWSFKWKIEFFNWEEEFLGEFLSLLQCVNLFKDREDT